ncbi:hypothetical protein, partial [Salmonella sp. s57610]
KMASMKAEKPIGSSLFGQKEPAAKSGDVAPKGRTSKAAPKKAAPKANPEPKKKAKGGKSTAKP